MKLQMTLTLETSSAVTEAILADWLALLESDVKSFAAQHVAGPGKGEPLVKVRFGEIRQVNKMLPESILALEYRMRVLEEEHARALGPTARRKIERKIDVLRVELAKLRAVEEKLHAAAERWWSRIEKRFRALEENGR